MKNYRCSIVFIMICMITLGGCSLRSDTDKFKEFIKSDITIGEFPHEVIELPSGHKLNAPMFFLDKEKNGYNPKVVLNVLSAPSDEWFLNLDGIKEDMKHLGEIVIEYAEKENWDNSYHLYTKIWLRNPLSELVYDYETDTLHVPNRYEDYMALYNTFETFDVQEIAKTDKGVEYLLSRWVGGMKHNKYEYDMDWLKSYKVNISDGEFKSYGYEDSYSY